MSDLVLVTSINAFVSVMTAILCVLNTIASKKTSKDVKITSADIKVLEKNTNSIKDELIKVTKSSSYAQGHLEGTREEKDRVKEN